MTINSPRDALNAILAYCHTEGGPLAAPVTAAHADMLDTVAKAAIAGLAQPDPTMGPPIPMPSWEAHTVAEALTVMTLQTGTPGRHYLPSAWVRAVCARAMVLLQRVPCMPLTPAQQTAEALLAVAIQYEEHLTSRFKDSMSTGAQPEAFEFAENPLAVEIVALRALLEPLRPLPPVPELIAALLTQAREEQMIDGHQMDELRDLARRMAK